MRAEGGRLIVDQDGPIRVARGHSAQFYVAGKYPERMELIVAPVAELKARITHVFEEIVSETLDRGTGTAAEAHGFTCGITGGSTALIFLGALRDADVAWSRVTLFWGDERAVPPESPESNYGLAEQMLLTPLGAKAPQAIRMPGEAPDLEQCRARIFSSAAAGARPADPRCWRRWACLFIVSGTSGLAGSKRASAGDHRLAQTAAAAVDADDGVRVAVPAGLDCRSG
jgi:hypothetical protein